MSSLIHNTIKIKLVNEGYLPNYPYHLISDREMCDAFLNDSENGTACFFYDSYPCLAPSLQSAYDELVESIKYHLQCLKDSKDAQFRLPDWVYSYMLGQVISINSPEEDKHDMFVLMNMDNVDDDFTSDISAECYEISRKWLSKLPQSKRDHRAPTLFGEPHVIKHLRLLQVEVT